MATDQQRGPAVSGPAPDLPERVVEDLLASERRRHLLSCLEGHNGMALADLAATVAARERGVDRAAVGDETRQAVREEIYADHLPKLTATGVVDFDSMTGVVRLRAADLTDR